MERMDLQLGDVQETALIPLAIRANETKRKNARIHDEKAVEIIDSLEIDTKDLDKFISHEGVVKDDCDCRRAAYVFFKGTGEDNPE